MFQQAADLKEEGEELKRVLDDLGEADWSRITPFKNWTVNQVVQHLHGSDKMAVLALKDADGFAVAKADPKVVGATMNPTEEGLVLLDTWWSYFSECVSYWVAATPKGGFLGLDQIWAS